MGTTVHHRWAVDYLHKGPLTWKIFPFDDIIMACVSFKRGWTSRIKIFHCSDISWTAFRLKSSTTLPFIQQLVQSSWWVVFRCDQAAIRTLITVCPSVYMSVCLSIRPSVTPFWQCSCHRIILKFSGVITIDRHDVHAKGQGQRGHDPI